MRKSVSFVLSPAVRLISSSGSSSPVAEQQSAAAAVAAVAAVAAQQQQQQQQDAFTICRVVPVPAPTPLLWSAPATAGGSWSLGPPMPPTRLDLGGWWSTGNETFDPATLAPLRLSLEEQKQEQSQEEAPAYDNSPFSPQTLTAIARLREEEKAARIQAIQTVQTVQSQFVEH